MNKILPNIPPARLHLFLASESPTAIIIRRGPSQVTAIFSWYRTTDHIKVGQWFKGRVFEYECDLSPDGKYFLYMARGHRSYHRWTALSKTPYIKALDFYNSYPWNTGGQFLDNQTYQFNQSEEYHPKFKTSSFKVMTTAELEQKNLTFEEFLSSRLQRDGWIQLDPADVTSFYKNINTDWQLIKRITHDDYALVPKALPYEFHELHNLKMRETLLRPDWEWTDIDDHQRNLPRLVYAEKGKLKAISFSNKQFDHTDVKELYDFNNMQFEAIKAPYDAPTLSIEELLKY